jgi:acyl-ACP--UDP-N-acetylglucosamine O-acyltransferase
VRVGSNTILGGDPQDLKFGGEETWVEVGDDTVIREFTHVNRGTTQSYRTTIGRSAFVMSFVHLAHDCHVGDGVILVNNSQLAGHVTVEEKAIIAGLTAVHQFVRIGRHAFVGGCSRVVKDVPPFVKAVGNPVKLFGLNTLGLQRSGFDDETLAELKARVPSIVPQRSAAHGGRSSAAARSSTCRGRACARCSTSSRRAAAGWASEPGGRGRRRSAHRRGGRGGARLPPRAILRDLPGRGSSGSTRPTRRGARASRGSSAWRRTRRSRRCSTRRTR